MKYGIALALLMWAGQGVRWDFPITGEAGRPAKSERIECFTLDGTTHVPLFADRQFQKPLPNPLDLKPDKYGNVFFYLAKAGATCIPSEASEDGKKHCIKFPRLPKAGTR